MIQKNEPKEITLGSFVLYGDYFVEEEMEFQCLVIVSDGWGFCINFTL